MAEFTSEKLKDWWLYQQKASLKDIGGTLKIFIVYFPMGIVELLLYLVLSLLSALFIVLPRGLRYWISIHITREVTMEDFVKKLDKDMQEPMRKQMIKNIERSTSFAQSVTVFILGIIATLLVQFFLASIRHNP